MSGCVTKAGGRGRRATPTVSAGLGAVAVAAGWMAGCTNPGPGGSASGEPVTVSFISLVAGGRTYADRCSACHGGEGEGVETAGPPLAGSPWVNGDPGTLTRVLLHGLRGPLEYGGRSYNLEMPAMGFLSDEELAALASFLRTSWGNRSGSIGPPEIAAVRRAEAGRGGAWTVDELGPVR